MKMIINTLIVSDIHLGSYVARPSQVLDLLKSLSFKRLILLGDIFDDLNFKRLKREHWDLLSYIRKLSNPDRNIEVIWVEGNHDEGLIEKLSHLIGIKAYMEYEFIINGNKIIAIHGHQFDRFLNENILISNISSFIYNKIQKYDREKLLVSRFIKRKSKGWLRLSHKVADNAIEYARRKNKNTVICGHTHQILQKSQNGISYFNSGCWTDIPSNYITIDNEGIVRISEFFEIEKLKLVS